MAQSASRGTAECISTPAGKFSSNCLFTFNKESAPSVVPIPITSVAYFRQISYETLQPFVISLSTSSHNERATVDVSKIMQIPDLRHGYYQSETRHSSLLNGTNSCTERIAF